LAVSEPLDKSGSPAPSAGQIERWVRQAQAGDLEAFDALVRQYQRQAVGVAYRLLNNVDDAMEVSQDALLNSFDKLKTLSKPSQFGSWLMRIVSNLALNRRRGRALRAAAPLEGAGGEDEERGERAQPDPHAQTPSEIVSGHEMEDRLEKALATLPEMESKALVMFSMAKMPQKEVAKVLGCSVEAVKWHVFMARKKLKELLAEYL
jgi:RNA polymerase sigma-70 factor (ECF subfamily)